MGKHQCFHTPGERLQALLVLLSRSWGAMPWQLRHLTARWGFKLQAIIGLSQPDQGSESARQPSQGLLRDQSRTWAESGWPTSEIELMMMFRVRSLLSFMAVLDSSAPCFYCDWNGAYRC